MKFFLYYFNYSVLNNRTHEFNLQNSNMLDFGAILYIPIKRVCTTIHHNSSLVMTDFIHHYFKRDLYFMTILNFFLTGQTIKYVKSFKHEYGK